MRITKDEARIIAIALQEYSFSTEVKVYEGYQVINNLQKKFEKEGRDKRREGRTSLDTLKNLFDRLKNQTND
ncbi:MAG: hypothetical protein RLZZ414_1068 [Bacteroidota bacterium]|jgi:hypothetical protein